MGPRTLFCRSPKFKRGYRNTTAIVSNPDNVHVILTIIPNGHNYFEFSMHANIRTLTEVLYFQILRKRQHEDVLNYSSYKGIRDPPLDPQAFCDLLSAYDSEPKNCK